MKPKYRQIARLLPASIFIAASLPFVAQADIFTDDTAGNAAPTAADVVASTIRANGGTNITNPLVTIISGVTMTGDILVPETEVLEITAANYSVTNAGSLAGSNHMGIYSTFAFTLNNSGTISGVGGGMEGVFTVGGLTSITNSGTITGADDAIYFNTDGGIVINSGTIDGVTGGSSDGIDGSNGISITNNSGGLIRGNLRGIVAGTTLNLTNNYNANVTGLTTVGVLASSGATIHNYGTITGATIGIDVTSGATINNRNTSIPSAGGQILGLAGNGITATTDLTLTNESRGLIQGSTNGIVATDGGTILTNVDNSGAITGLAGDGISALNSFVILNNAGGVITGSGDGINIGDYAEITNYGTITATGNDGINAGLGSIITNYITGTITGGGDAIDFDGTGDPNTINNYGIIDGGSGQAIDGSGSVETVNLYLGSRVIGDVDGNGGLDILNFNGGLTSTSSATGSSSNSILGNVTGFNDINKTGTGTAFVTGNVNSDTIDVTGGALYIVGTVAGTLNPQSAISAIGGQIGGTGTWDANIGLTNSAIISPGQINLPIASPVANSVGALTVTGDVTLDATSDYVWNVTPTPNTLLVPGTTSDQIILTGGGNQFSTTNSDFVIAPTNVNTPIRTGTTIVVDTQDTLLGTFDSITVGAFPSTTTDSGPFVANQINPILAANFATLSKVNASQDWQLTITHNYSQFGSTANEVAAGNMLDGLVNTATGNLAQLLAALDYSSAQTTEATLAALDPGSFLASAAGLVSNNYHLHRTVENHNAAVRAGWGAVSMPAADPSAKGAVAPVATGCAGRSNVWGSVSYDWQDLSTGNSAFDQDGETASFTAGIDFTVAENFRLGLVAEGSQSSWDGNGNLGSDIDSYRIAGYANWGAATGWYVDALLGYNASSVDQSRFVSMGNLAGAQTGGYDADGWQGMITVGNTIATSAGMFSPFIGLEMQQLSSDSFTATGSPLPIGLSSFDIDSIRGLIGVKWEADIAQKLKAYASVAYAYEFQGDAPTTTVSFGGGSYTATGQGLGDSVLLSTGMRWNVATCTTVDFGYRGEFAMDDGLDSHGANVGVNFSF